MYHKLLDEIYLAVVDWSWKAKLVSFILIRNWWHRTSSILNYRKTFKIRTSAELNCLQLYLHRLPRYPRCCQPCSSSRWPGSLVSLLLHPPFVLTHNSQVWSNRFNNFVLVLGQNRNCFFQNRVFFKTAKSFGFNFKECLNRLLYSTSTKTKIIYCLFSTMITLSHYSKGNCV